MTGKAALLSILSDETIGEEDERKMRSLSCAKTSKMSTTMLEKLRDNHFGKGSSAEGAATTVVGIIAELLNGTTIADKQQHRKDTSGDRTNTTAASSAEGMLCVPQLSF